MAADERAVLAFFCAIASRCAVRTWLLLHVEHVARNGGVRAALVCIAHAQVPGQERHEAKEARRRKIGDYGTAVARAAAVSEASVSQLLITHTHLVMLHSGRGPR